MDRTSYYTILEVEPNASEGEIRRAFTQKVRRYSNEADPEAYQLIREAYDTLIDSERRQAYDEQLTQGDLIPLINNAESLLNEGRISQAMSEIYRVLRKNPDHIHARKLLAKCFIENEGYDQAIQQLKKLQNDAPNDVAIPFDLARAYFRMENHREAERYLKQARLLAPKDDDLIIFLANIYHRSERADDIFELLKRRINQTPTMRDFPIVLAHWEHAMFFNYEDEVKIAEDQLINLAAIDQEQIVYAIINMVEGYSERWIGFKHSLDFIRRINHPQIQEVVQWVNEMTRYINDQTYYYGDHDYGEFAIKHGGKYGKTSPGYAEQAATQYDTPNDTPNPQPSATEADESLGGSLVWAIVFGIIGAVFFGSGGIGIGIAVAWFFLGGLLKRFLSPLLGCGCLVLIVLFIIGFISEIL